MEVNARQGWVVCETSHAGEILASPLLWLLGAGAPTVLPLTAVWVERDINLTSFLLHSTAAAAGLRTPNTTPHHTTPHTPVH